MSLAGNCGRRAGAAAMGFMVATLSMASPSGAQTASRPTKTLGRGRLSQMRWAAWAETAPKGGASHGEEVCVSVLTIEPGIQGGREGSESTNCGSAKSTPVDEVVRSPYGVVVAALFPREAARAIVTFKGRPKQSLRLKRRAIGWLKGFPYLAQSFPAHTCIERIRVVDAEDESITSISAGRCVK